MARSLLPFLLLTEMLAGGGLALAAPPKARVSLEILTKKGVPITASQQWYKVFSELGVAGLQIHDAGAGGEPAVSEQGSKSDPAYKVVGILGSDNVLYLPGGKFSPRDKGPLRKWLENLSDLGAEGVTAPRTAFDLVPKQLEQVHDDLARPVGFSTHDVAAGDAVSQIGDRLQIPFELTEGAKRALAGVVVDDELQGISAGTALAAILRPAGLTLAPHRPQGGELRYRIGKSQVGEAWPVGWKPQKKAHETLPELFDFLNVEIEDVPLSEAIEAIQERLQIPFLFDHNALALHGIDPAKMRASIPNKRSTYSLILQKVLGQAKLKYELRLDEANKPLLWITSIKPAQ